MPRCICCDVSSDAGSLSTTSPNTKKFIYDQDALGYYCEPCFKLEVATDDEDEGAFTTLVDSWDES